MADPVADTPDFWRISGNLVDPLARRIRPATLTISSGRIAGISWDSIEHDTWLLPGFVDAHVHVESSLLPPSEFARMAVAHGTVATVSDPHEIANVLGIPGVEFMLNDARRSPFHFCFGAPSCVPATPFDHAGATLDAAGVAALLDRPDIGYLSEVMNYPGVVAGDTDVLAVVKAELFPTNVRALGVALPYGIATAVFGGTAEPIALAFKQAGVESGFFIYVALGLAVSLLASLFLPDTRKHSMILED